MMEVVEVNCLIVVFFLNNDNILEYKLHGSIFYVDSSRQKSDGSMAIAILKLPSKYGFSCIHIKIRIDVRVFLIATNIILE